MVTIQFSAYQLFLKCLIFAELIILVITENELYPNSIIPQVLTLIFLFINECFSKVETSICNMLQYLLHVKERNIHVFTYVYIYLSMCICV